METFKVYKTSNIFYKYVYVLMSVVKSKESNAATVELYIIMKNWNNEIKTLDRAYKYYTSTIDIISIYEKDLNSFLFEHALETSKETLTWEIIYPQYKGDTHYPLFSAKELILKEIKATFLIDLLFSDRDMFEILVNTKESTKNEELKDFLQNIIKITQRKLY